MINPQLYTKSNSLQRIDAYEVLQIHCKNLEWTKEENVLDIGCGPGDVTANILLPFLANDALVVGSDLSQEMVKHANGFNKNERLVFKQLDIQEKNIENFKLESFNKIFSFYCFHWVTDHRQALHNIYSLLKPGGDILLLLATPDNFAYLTIEKLKTSEKWQKYMKEVKWFYNSNDPVSYFKSILQDVGFKEINCYLKTCRHNIPSWESILGSLESVNPYISCIPTDLKLDYLQELGDLIKQGKYIVPDEINGGFQTEYKLMVVLAKKFK